MRARLIEAIQEVEGVGDVRAAELRVRATPVGKLVVLEGDTREARGSAPPSSAAT